MSLLDSQIPELLSRKLQSLAAISAAEEDTLAALPWRYEDFGPRHQFVGVGDTPTASCIVVSGFVVRGRYTEAGERQILSVHIPGDLPDLQSLNLRRMDHSLETIGRCRVGFVSHNALRRACEHTSSLVTAFWRETLVDASLYRAAIFRNGQLEPVARLAHFLCELYFRHKAVGLVGPKGFPFQMSQEVTGEVLGLTVVSVNRAAKALRAQGLLETTDRHIHVPDVTALCRIGQFDRTFLHQGER